MTVEIHKTIHLVEITGTGASSSSSALVAGLPAGASINAFFAVVLINGALYPADLSNPVHAGKVVGVASQSGLSGEDVRIYTEGRLTGFPLNLTQGATYFVGTGGMLTTTPLTVGAAWRQKMGLAQSNSVLFVQMEDAVLTA